jgi:hypothetical protein
MGYSSSGTGGSVITLQHLARQVGGLISLCSGFTAIVDIRSIAGSSCPSRCGQETEGEATSHSWVGR